MILFFTLMTSMICFCRGPEFSDELINQSDLIVEAKLSSIKWIDSKDNNLSISFKVIEKYKGEVDRTFIVHTDNSSCGYYLDKDTKTFNQKGKIFLLYLNKTNGEYTYMTCEDRMMEKPNKKDIEGSFYTQKDYKDDLIKFNEENEAIRKNKLIKTPGSVRKK